MTNKKTFPGAMNAEQRAALAQQQAEQEREALRAKRLAAEKAEAARIIAEQKKQEAQKREAIIEKFSPNMKSKFATFCTFCLPLNMFIGCADHVLVDQDPYDTDLGVVVKTDEAVREAYDPCFHAADNLTLNSKAYRDSKINDRFKRHMALIGIEAFVLACIGLGVLRKRRAVAKDVDVMLAIEKAAQQHKIDNKLLTKMMKVAPEIVSHMSKESAIYFEALMNGSLDCEQNTQVFAIAKSVLAGHLASHPEDMQRVLAVFDEASLPQSLVAEYKQNVR